MTRTLPLCPGHLTPAARPILLCMPCTRRWRAKAGEPVLHPLPFVPNGWGGTCAMRAAPDESPSTEATAVATGDLPPALHGAAGLSSN